MTPKQRAYLEALRDDRAPGSVASGAAGTRVRNALLAAGLVYNAPVVLAMTRPDGSKYEFRTSRPALTDLGRKELS